MPFPQPTESLKLKQVGRIYLPFPRLGLLPATGRPLPARRRLARGVPIVGTQNGRGSSSSSHSSPRKTKCPTHNAKVGVLTQVTPRGRTG